MSLNCGIVGLPNVGKSTIFSAMTAHPVEIANYPFCTIDRNMGLVSLPDPRLHKAADIVDQGNRVPAIVEFVDIAGLVKGASKGEGKGNEFLSHIREVSAIIHVVRCFDDTDITHVHETIDPVRDIEIVNIELALADLATVQKRRESVDRMTRNQDKAILKQGAFLTGILDKIEAALDEGKAARTVSLINEESEAIKDLHLITMKKILYVCNIDEEGIEEDNAYVKQVKEYAGEEDSEVLVICGKLEAEIALLESEEEKREFLDSVGIEESGFSRLVRSAYAMLGLKTFFTKNEKEIRAWTYPEGSKAPEAAGIIHNDFKKGFIKAEVYHCDDLFEYGSEHAVKEHGKLRIEGKEYLVRDGDMILFRFNV
ncbi:MAG: redox-regulated ATPase YchF [bacterium]|nr:redox-regulated ATPase YchF [bacterium]